MKIRRIGADERVHTAFPLQAYAFERTPTPAAEAEKFPSSLPYTAGNVTLVVDDDGTAQAVASAIPMRQNVRGTVYPMAGIAAVASHPLARRRGHVRTLMVQLLGEMRDSGHVVSTLYPFRPSFYQRFGYASLPKPRRVTFSPADLAPLLRADLPGEVTLQRIKDGYPTYRDLTLRLLDSRHGFAVFPDYRAESLRDEDDHWLAVARAGDEVVGAVTYRITGIGGELRADYPLTTGPLGRALLLRFFAHHADQVERVVTQAAADDTPELWATDLNVVSEARAQSPSTNAPMARVLSVDGLAGLAVGPGRLTVSVVDDPFIAGTYHLDGTSGKLDVAAGDGPAATLTVPGFSALVYGVLDPAEVVVRGLGTVPDDAAGQLRALFGRRLPYLHADF